MPSPRWDIYEELLSEAGFLWTQWMQAMRAPDYTLDEIARGDEARLRAALDGLVVGGAPVRERLLLPALEEGEDTERMMAASWALLAAEGPERSDTALLEGIEDAGRERQAALEWALVLGPEAPVRTAIAALLRKRDSSTQALALRVLGARPELVADAGVLDPFLHDDRPPTLAAALRALPPVIEPRHRARVETLACADEPATRNAALEAGAILGLPAVRRACLDVAHARDETAGTALLLTALGGGSAGDLALVPRALGVPALRREALWALGFGGTPAAAESCLPLLSDEEHGRAAAEAFCLITGLDLVREKLVEPPDDDAADADADWRPVRTEPRESELAYKPDQQLPLANVEGVERWWAAHADAFKPGARYRHGQVFDGAAVWPALAMGPCRRRPVHAMEAAMQARGRALISVRRWTTDQRAQTEHAQREARR